MSINQKKGDHDSFFTMSYSVEPPKLIGGAAVLPLDMLELFGILLKLLGLKLSIPSDPVIDMLGPSLL